MDELAYSAWRAHLGRKTINAAQLRAELSSGSLPEVVAANARRRGGAPAITIDGLSVSHRHLDWGAARVAGWLRAQGVAPQDRVVLAGWSSPAVVVAYIGVLRAEAIAVPVGAEMSDDELVEVIGDAEPVGAFVGTPVLKNQFFRVAERGIALRFVISVRDGLPMGTPLPIRPTSAAAILAYTSGTTGRAKGVLLSQANLLASIRAAMLAWRWSRDDLLVHALPLSHQHGLSGVHATLLAGSRAHLLSRFEPDRLLECIRSERATVLFAVPAMYERLCTRDAELDSLRLAVSGSASLSPTLAERVRQWLGEVPLERYGSTEAGLNLSNLYAGRRLPGSVGYPLPGIEIRVVNSDASVIPAGQVGELVVRGPQVFTTYWRRPAETAEAWTESGWFRTGDLARVDPETGAVEITGRLKELIITGGLNVSPVEVERRLEEHPDIERAAVVGVPSQRWGEEVVAFVVPRRATEKEDLLAHCRERLSAYKCPKRVYVIADLPTNSLGKINRAELAMLAGRQPKEA